MKQYAFLILVVFLISSCQQNQKQVTSESMSQEEMMAHNDNGVRDGVFIHITESYNDPHKVLMPLKMAVMMANDKDVLIYNDIKSVELYVKSAKDLQYADFESLQTYVKQLAEKNVGVYVCPTCLKMAGFSEADLLDGVKTAQKDKFFNFTKGRIITLDY
jgi:predicted peroxiredoxin